MTGVRCRREDNAKKHHNRTVCEDVNWIFVDLNRIQERFLVKTVMKIVENLLIATFEVLTVMWLDCDGVSSGESFPTFRNIILPSSSGSSSSRRRRVLHPEDEGTAVLRNALNYLPKDIHVRFTECQNRLQTNELVARIYYSLFHGYISETVQCLNFNTEYSIQYTWGTIVRTGADFMASLRLTQVSLR
jgi:hypothetical protein